MTFDTATIVMIVVGGVVLFIGIRAIYQALAGGRKGEATAATHVHKRCPSCGWEGMVSKYHRKCSNCGAQLP